MLWPETTRASAGVFGETHYGLADGLVVEGGSRGSTKGPEVGPIYTGPGKRVFAKPSEANVSGQRDVERMEAALPICECVIITQQIVLHQLVADAFSALGAALLRSNANRMQAGRPSLGPYFSMSTFRT